MNFYFFLKTIEITRFFLLRFKKWNRVSYFGTEGGNEFEYFRSKRFENRYSTK